MTAHAAYPPFSGEDVTCPKCGNSGADTVYKAHGRCSHPDGSIVLGWDPNERLCRSCNRCGYGWDEATVDQVPADPAPISVPVHPRDTLAGQPWEPTP